jgi:hypothetical protein
MKFARYIALVLTAIFAGMTFGTPAQAAESEQDCKSVVYDATGLNALGASPDLLRQADKLKSDTSAVVRIRLIRGNPARYLSRQLHNKHCGSWQDYGHTRYETLVAIIMNTRGHGAIMYGRDYDKTLEGKLGPTNRAMRTALRQHDNHGAALAAEKGVYSHLAKESKSASRSAYLGLAAIFVIAVICLLVMWLLRRRSGGGTGADIGQTYPIGGSFFSGPKV